MLASAVAWPEGDDLDILLGVQRHMRRADPLEGPGLGTELRPELWERPDAEAVVSGSP